MLLGMALGDNFGLSISHSWVDSNFLPTGWLMLIGLSVGLIFLVGVPGWRKWNVAPASDIPNSLIIWIGLAALFAVSSVLEKLLIVTMMSFLSLVASAAY